MSVFSVLYMFVTCTCTIMYGQCCCGFVRSLMDSDWLVHSTGMVLEAYVATSHSACNR